MPYPEGKERIFIDTFGAVDEDPTPARAKKRYTACASTKQEYQWLNANVCVHRQGGRMQLPQLQNSQIVGDFIRNLYAQEMSAAQEFVGVVALDVRNRPVGAALIHKGGDAISLADPKSILRAVLMLPATGFILFHNHPSEDTAPSADDADLTRNLKAAADAIRLRFLDHLIISPAGTQYSFVEHGKF